MTIMLNILLAKETSGGKMMRGGGGEKLNTSAQKIMAGVRRVGLGFKMDSLTDGDGNCFPRAARQQCLRREVGISFIKDHKDLRKKVTQYMLTSEDRVVVNMRRRWEELEVRWSWESYWQNMDRDGVWVEEVFVWATAWYLNRDIWIVWDTATPQTSITFFSGDREGNGTVCPGVPLIIGHHTDTHYQSLLPEGDPACISLDTSRFAVEVNTTLEKFGESHQRKSRLKRKELPGSSDSEEDGDTQVIILKFGQGKPGVEARKLQDGGVQYSCLLCNTQQKQFVSHMKKMHPDMFQNKELEEFQVLLKRFANSTRYNKWHSKERERDPARLKENNRQKKANSRAKQNKENPKEVKKRKKRENQTRRGNGERKFKEENQSGPIFPCVCCHTLKFIHQTVLFTKEQAEKIDQKARELHEALQVIYKYISKYLIKFENMRY